MSKKYLPVLTLMILVLDSDACSIDNYICCLRNITFNAMVTIQNMYDMDMMIDECDNQCALGADYLAWITF